jgi:hypothetical protein
MQRSNAGFPPPYMGTNPITSSKPNYFPKDPPPNDITEDIRDSTHESGAQTFSPQEAIFRGFSYIILMN